MLRAIATAILVTLAAVGLAACSGQPLEEIDPEVGVTNVTVEDNHYGPRVIQVAPGTEVTWTWEGDDRHNVMGEGFQSEIQKEGMFAHTFQEPGWYRFICSLHAGMTGAVSVVE